MEDFHWNYYFWQPDWRSTNAGFVKFFDVQLMFTVKFSEMNCFLDFHPFLDSQAGKQNTRSPSTKWAKTAKKKKKPAFPSAGSLAPVSPRFSWLARPRATGALGTRLEAFWSVGLWVRDCFGPDAPLIAELAWLRVHRGQRQRRFLFILFIY